MQKFPAALFVLILSACGHDYPLVANGFSETAELSALDNEGRGNFAEPVESKGCLLAFKKMPDLTTMQIRVVIEGKVDRTYDSAALRQALAGEDFSKGVFVVDAAGVHFSYGFECESEMR